MTTPSSVPAPKAPDDVSLAWELAATAHPYLSRVDADRIYVALGIGEPFAAIEALVTAIAQNHIPLSDELVATIVTWLDGYVGQNAEPRLRELLAELTTNAGQRISTRSEPAGSGSDGAQDWQLRSG